MPKLRTGGAISGRRDAGLSPRRPLQGEAPSNAAVKTAMTRFTYSGGFDGYEGRMIVRPGASPPPEADREAGGDRSGRVS